MNIMKLFKNDLNNINQTLLLDNINSNNNKNKKIKNDDNYNNNIASNVNKKKSYYLSVSLYYFTII